MLLNGAEVNRDNVHDWSKGDLNGFKEALAEKFKNREGDLKEEGLLFDLIDIELDYRTEYEAITKNAREQKRAVIKKYDSMVDDNEIAD